MTTWDELAERVRGIVADATRLKDERAGTATATVSYCAVFCQSDDEFASLDAAARSIGTLANDTATGPVFVVPQIDTLGGPLRIVKIRAPDKTRKERGDADFAVRGYKEFKQGVLGKDGFKLIERDEFEMIELVDSAFDVRAYFSYPPVEEHSGIREALSATPSD